MILLIITITSFILLLIIFILFIYSPSYLPPSDSPSYYLPPSESPSYLPPSESPSESPSYLPPSESPSYLPPSESPSYLPPSYSPSESPSYLPPSESPSYLPPSESPSFKKVIYTGYWLSDEDIDTLIETWKKGDITHIVLEFIYQPDISKPLEYTDSVQAFFDLTDENKEKLVSNFIIGFSIGGANGMPSPYSQTFSTGYYQNNPKGYAQDIANIGGQYIKYFDLDIEHINDLFDETATFLGEVCQNLKNIVPGCIISHAPQPPYFTPQFGNIYLTLYKNYSQYFDFMSIQYYNNGPSQTYDQIFIESDVNYAPKTSVFELMNQGILPSYIVIGKPVNESQGDAGGYVPLPQLTNFFQQALQDYRVQDWTKDGGSMIWFYNCQQPSTDPDNASILQFFENLFQK